MSREDNALMNSPIGRRALFAGVAAGSAFTVVRARAQAFPSRTVTLVVPFPPGGTIDVLARLTAQQLTGRFGVPAVVENRAGAGGTIGAAAVARSQPDGYTILVSNVGSNGIGPALYRNIPYRPLEDFEHIGCFGAFPNVLVVRPDFPVSTIGELIALARQKPGELAFGSPGNGLAPHLAGEMLMHATGIRLLHVPYRGAGEARQAFLSGEVPILFENLPTVLPMARDGQMKPLLVTSPVRATGLPEVPTAIELGMKGFTNESWEGLSAPRGTAAAVVEVLSQALQETLAKPEVNARLTGMGIRIDYTKPDEYRAFIADELKKWDAVIRTAGIHLD
ncbi:Bug family tripartite tricarboxylate transporter substrate binding protein [Roseomonas chloroacetimidivorans]|uniref:Bug family tripartite tricarboxylate transporter substrate binding protein n=1 Tax=Roseomonas chloroacetimidivorans TaxID=1766656 RepID=UPI003C74430A